MKKKMFAVVIVMLALGVFASVVSAQSTEQNAGLLHDYMEKALAEKLGVPLATVEAAVRCWEKPLPDRSSDKGIAQTDLPAFMLKVRTTAINAALSDGVITQSTELTGCFSSGVVEWDRA